MRAWETVGLQRCCLDQGATILRRRGVTNRWLLQRVLGGYRARAANARLRQNRIPKSNLYLIEEPSIGLHAADVKRLLEVLHRLVDDGHTVVVIEHNLEIMAEADYVLEIGPEAGADGGKVVGAGTPEEVIEVKESRTAPFLRKQLK